MIKGFDCYDTPSDFVLARAVRLGYQVICQYYGPTGSPKVTTVDEAGRISRAGLKLFSVFERSTARPLQGRSAGLEDASLAVTQAIAAGQPAKTTIAFAVDSDVDVNVEANRNAVMAYFTAIREVLAGRYRLGGYGSGDVLNLLIGAGLVEVSWLAGAMGWRGSDRKSVV